ncbi:hypothetical protein [Zhihengliuella halotolerans]|uniref:hypothetical protein n=1 Tax=Zhihengliuella halotolerans TaxID=370736 RepID=UPI0015E0FD58|nr:hypothetical protein [Zhihengliuella halotolerans]
MSSREYSEMFPDRVVVLPTATGFAVVNRWCVRDRRNTQVEAMTAAYELASRCGRE